MYLDATALALALALSMMQGGPGLWQQIDNAAGECSLGRKLPQNGLTLSITKRLGSDEAGIAIEDPRGPIRYGGYKDVQIALDNGWSGAGFGSSGSTDVRTTSLLHVSVIDPQFIDRVRSAKWITITHSKLGSHRFALGSDGFPLSAIRECEDLELHKLGINPTLWRARAAPEPLVSSGMLVSGADYTPLMIRRNLGGTVPVLLTIGTNGRVQACKPLTADAHQELKDVTCRLMKQRARFRPAVDPNGKPVNGEYFISITYHITDG